MTLDEQGEPQWVCLKVIKNSKDFFDQSLDEIKLLQYINSNGDPDQNHVLRLVDYFYCKGSKNYLKFTFLPSNVPTTIPNTKHHPNPSF